MSKMVKKKRLSDIPIIPVKVCKSCQRTLPIHLFSKKCDSQDRLQPICKACLVEIVRNWRALHPDRCLIHWHNDFRKTTNRIGRLGTSWYKLSTGHKAMTGKQKLVYTIIKDYQDSTGEGISSRTMAILIGVSRRAVLNRIGKLRRYGWIQKCSPETA